MPTNLIEWIVFIFSSLLLSFFIISIVKMEIEHRKTIKVIKLLNDTGKEVRLLTFLLQQSHNRFINHLK